MDRFKSSFFSLDSFFEAAPCSLPEALRERLQLLTGGKACLLCELPDDALRRLSLEFKDTLPELRRVRDEAVSRVGPSSDPSRYLHLGVHALAALPRNIPFSAFAASGRLPHWTWVEVAAAQGPLTPQNFSDAMDCIFEERLHLPDGCHPFRERLVHSGCSHFLPPYMPDDPANDASWEGPPRKKLKLMSSEALHSGVHTFIDPRKWRFPGLLAREAALRTASRSIMASRKSYRSGIRAWGAWVSFRFPFRDPFRVDTEMICTFSSAFHMASTFKEYWGHVRFGVRLLGLPFEHLEHTVQQLLRGCKKGRRKRVLHCLRRADVLRIILHCHQKGELSLARFFSCARAGLFRVMNELLPLQRDGPAGLPQDSLAWHSRLSFEADSVAVHLRTRKCHPFGDVIRRSCTCRRSSDVFCMFHCLKTQVDSQSSTRESIWPFSRAELIKAFQRILRDLGLPPGTGFHAFRRGMARDLLASGQQLSFILRAGGWRSSAFLNYLTSSGLDEREAMDFSMADSDSE